MSTMQHYLPTVEAVQRLLMGLLGRNVTLKKGVAGSYGDRARAALGHYVRDDGNVGMLWASELGLMANAAAALTLIPHDVVNAGLRSGALGPDLVENIHEVLNVGASLMNHAPAAHVKLKEVLFTPGKVPQEVTQVLGRPAVRLDLEVAIAGYAGGKMSILLA